LSKATRAGRRELQREQQTGRSSQNTADARPTVTAKLRSLFGQSSPKSGATPSAAPQYRGRQLERRQAPERARRGRSAEQARGDEGQEKRMLSQPRLSA
jgi:hypothetical protein